MTRIAGTNTKERRNRLMTIAAYEFATVGFQEASLRIFCKKAGLSTGSVYFFFDSKEGLFCSIVEEVSTYLLSLLKTHCEEEKNYTLKDISNSEEKDFQQFTAFLKYYYENKTFCDCLIKNKTHPAVEKFFNETTEILEKHYLKLLKNIALVQSRSTPIDEFAVKWFSKTEIDMILNLLKMEFKEDEAIEHSKNLIKIMEKGFTGLL